MSFQKALDYFCTGSLDQILVAVCTVLIISYILKSWLSRPKNFPPGPKGLPIVGYLPFLEPKLHMCFKNLEKTYGKIFSLKLGSTYAIVLQDYQDVKLSLMKKEFLDRPHPTPLNLVPNATGVFFMNGSEWVEQRKHSLTYLKNVGMGKSSFSEQMQEEINDVIEELERLKGKPCDFKPILFQGLCNIMWVLLFGSRLETNDPRKKVLFEIVDKTMSYMTDTVPFTFFPRFLSLIRLLNIGNYKKVSKLYDDLYEIAQKEINKKMKDLHSKSPSDFTDFFLLEISHSEKDPNSTFNMSTLKGNIVVFYIAGIVAIQVALIWLMTTMAARPNLQKKIFEEIKSLTGNTRNVQLEDRQQLPYTMAFIHEMQRWKTLVPISDFRCAAEDTTFQGFNIPKGTFVLNNLWGAHFDPKLWEDPEEFRPERFLSKDGTTFVKPPGYFPFALGRRNCPGESMAYMEIFLFFARFLQNFEIQAPPGTTADIETEIFKSIVEPKPQDLCFIKRG